MRIHLWHVSLYWASVNMLGQTIYLMQRNGVEKKEREGKNETSDLICSPTCLCPYYISLIKYVGADLITNCLGVEIYKWN